MTDCECTLLKGLIGNAPPFYNSQASGLINNLGDDNAVWVDGGRDDSYIQTGKQGTPFKNITDAKNNLDGRETIIVHPGTYNENFDLDDGGYNIIGIDRENTRIVSALDTIVATSITGDTRLENLTIETTGAYTALDLDGIASGKFLRLRNLKLEAPATGYGMDIKNMLSPAGVYMENIECNGRAILEALRLNAHGFYLFSILGGTPGLSLIDCVNLFMNDLFSVTAGGTSVAVDNCTSSELHSIIVQTIGGSSDCFDVLNGSVLQVSDLRIANNTAQDDIHVDNSDLQILTGRYDKNKVSLTNGGIITLLTPASRVDNDSATVSGATVADALDDLEVNKEDAFSKNTAFNKNFGFTSVDVPRGDLVEQLANKDAANGYPGLDGSSKINPAQLPALAITDTYTVANETEQLALTIQKGDVAVRTDQNKSYINTTGNNTSMSDWQELLTPTDAVSSVFSRTGVVTAQNGDYNAGQVTNTPAGGIAAVTVQAAINELDTEKEPAIGAKGTAFNKNFGTASDTVCEGDDSRLSDARTPTQHGIDNNTYHAGVSGATENNFASFDANGLPKDSGKKDADYLDSAGNDFGNYPQKTAANKADRFLQEDSADSNNKKYIELQHMIVGAGIQTIAKKTLTFSSSASGTVLSNPAAGKLIIFGIIIEVRVAFNGTTPVISVGDGNDAGGFISGADISGAGKLGEIHSTRGAYLWNSGSSSSRTFLYTGADTIDYALTLGGSTTGELDIYLLGSYAGYIQDQSA